MCKSKMWLFVLLNFVTTGNLFAASFGIAIDTSGSMQEKGRAIAAAEGAQLVIEMLNDGDSVRIIGFHSDALVSPSYKMPADRKAAKDFVKSFRPGGGTNYLSALGVPSLNGIDELIFLSDGEHNGSPETVIDLIRKQVKIPIHTISVGTQAASGAEKLLSTMSSLTKGTTVHAENSEELIQALVKFAARLNGYRRHSPKQSPISFDCMPGKILAFAYDGKPELSLHSKTPIRTHQALLPGEKVQLAIGEIDKPQLVTVQLKDATRSNSRLAEIHVQGLPDGKLTVNTDDQGRVRAGDQMSSKLKFVDAGGKPLNVNVHTNLSALIHLVDRTGKILETIKAIPNKDGTALEAKLKVPETPGASLTVRADSEVDSQNLTFQETDEQTVTVVESTKLVVTPKSLSLRPKMGKFDAKLKAQIQGKHSPESKFAVDLIDSPKGLQLIDCRTDMGGCTIEFSATANGKLTGKCRLHLAGEPAAVPVDVPFTFDIQPKSLGLKLANEPISLGATTAGSSDVRVLVPITSLDDESLEYTVETADLERGNATLPLSSPEMTIHPTRMKPASLMLIAETGNAAPGKYEGSVIFRDQESGLNREWKRRVVLTVLEPLLGLPLDAGKLEPGQPFSAKLIIKNSSANAVKNVTVVLPTNWSTKQGNTVDILMQTEKSDLGDIPPKSDFEMPFTLLISPALAERGKFQGDVVVRRGDIDALTIPVTTTVVNAGEGTEGLSITPGRINLKASPGRVVEFTLKAKLTKARNVDQDELELVVGPMRDMNQKPIAVESMITWEGESTKLDQGESRSAKCLVIAPLSKGTYVGDIVIRTMRSGTKKISMTLTVE